MSQSRGESSNSAKAAPTSAGILLYGRYAGDVQVLLAHPGGPFFIRQDEGAWSIPKGLVNPGESPQEAALREFEEELGWRPEGALVELGEARLKSGKRVVAFAMRTHDPPAALLERFAPGLFVMEWPRGSGRHASFPEVDRIEFFSVDAARIKINPAQAALLDRLAALLA